MSTRVQPKQNELKLHKVISASCFIRRPPNTTCLTLSFCPFSYSSLLFLWYFWTWLVTMPPKQCLPKLEIRLSFFCFSLFSANVRLLACRVATLLNTSFPFCLFLLLIHKSGLQTFFLKLPQKYFWKTM